MISKTRILKSIVAQVLSETGKSPVLVNIMYEKGIMTSFFWIEGMNQKEDEPIVSPVDGTDAYMLEIMFLPELRKQTKSKVINWT